MAGYDVLVLGGGTAGCALAARLSEEPSRRVCLVEAGPDYGAYAAGGWPEDILDARWLAFSHSWETDRDDRSQLRARILGGCSSHNACVVIAGAPEDYDEWGDGWRYAELEPYLARARAQLRTRATTPEELTPWHGAWAEAAGEDAILHDVNIADGVRWNAAFAYLDEARPRENLTVVPDALVDRVLLEGDRAVGAVTSAGELRASTVVVAGGAYGSPGILLRSGLTPERGLPVGEGLLDHVGVGVGWTATDDFAGAMAAFDGPVPMAQVTVKLRCDCPPELWDGFGFPALEPVENGWEISGAVFCMKPVSRGRVRLNGPDPRMPLAIEHGFLADDRDAVVLTTALERLRELATHPAIAAFASAEARPGPGVPAEQHVRETARGFFHPTGTCAIGRVVDPRGRVLGIEGLVVADASIMPTIPRVNTNLSTAAVAERLAETI